MTSGGLELGTSSTPQPRDNCEWEIGIHPPSHSSKTFNMTLEQRDIRKYNRLIAIYMGGKCEIAFTSTVIVKFKDKSYTLGTLKYHKNWNWLMPVVEKICKERYLDGDNKYLRQLGMLTDTDKFMARFNRHQLFMGNDLMKVIYDAVVDVICID